jgi:hypothetical protein
LLSGLAAISSAYPPDLSIHLETIEASREQEKPLFSCKKLGPNRTIAKEEKERKGKSAKKAEKQRFFCGHVQNVLISCGKTRFGREFEQDLGVLCCLIPN